MESKKVSIIVPVYKVEKYLEECLDSLKNQTYNNLEIILCDDESPDRCPQICEKYAKQDKRFKVLHKKNGGAASARNAGLEIATGDYIGFVDSDDLVKKDYIYHLVEILEINNADISVCSFSNMYVNREDAVKMEKEGYYSPEQYLERFLWDWKCGLIWNKLFRKELVQNIRFPEGHVIDDEFFTYRLVMNARKIVVEDIPLYRYRQRKSGVMKQGRQNKILMDRKEYFPERYERVVQNYPKLNKKYLENLSDNIIRLVREAVQFDGTFQKARKLQKTYLVKVIFGPINIKEKYSYVRELFSRTYNFKEEYIEIKDIYFE